MTKKEFKQLSKKLKHKVRIPLKAKIKNIRNNINKNPNVLIPAIIGVGACVATYLLGSELSEHFSKVEYYDQAHNWLSSLDSFLQSSQEINLIPQIPADLLDTPINLVKQGSEMIYRDAAMDFISKAQKENIEIFQAGNSNIPDMRESISELKTQITPLISSTKETLLRIGTIASGAVSALGAIGSVSDLSDQGWDWWDNLKNEKHAKKEIKIFLRDFKEELKLDSKLSKSKLKYLNNINLDKLNIDTIRERVDLCHRVSKKERPLLEALIGNDHDHYNILNDYRDIINSNYKFFKSGWEVDESQVLLDYLQKNEDPEKIIYLFRDLRDAPRRAQNILSKLITSKKYSIDRLSGVEDFLSNNRNIPEDIYKKIINFQLERNDDPNPKWGRVYINDFKDYIIHKSKIIPDNELIDLIEQTHDLQNLHLSSKIPTGSEQYFSTIDFIYRLHKKGDKTLVEKAFEMNLPKNVKEADADLFLDIDTAGYAPTPYLIRRLQNSTDKNAELNLWLKTTHKIKQGGFDPSDELMKNLEYTQYFKHSRDIRQSSTFDSYENLLQEGKI